MCASTGSGEGRSVITNNILLWPGSLVVYDPKGDLPAVCAPGRGQGDEFATAPMGQKVIVLDPLGHSKSDPSYLGYYDPVTSLDRDDPGFRGMCSFLAEALIKVPEDSNHAEWAKMGRDLLSTIIEHVVSTPDYDDRPEERNLFTVLNLLKKGRRDLQIQYCNELVEKGELDKKDVNKRLEDLGDPYVLLFDEIAENPHNSYIRDYGDRWRQSYLRTAKTFTSIRDEAVRGLDWITKDVGMETALVGTRHGSPVLPSSQRFDPRELKQNPEGVSLFIVLPSDQMETYGAWVQAVFMGIFASMRRTPAHPDLAHPTLGIIDEFSSLGKQDYIANALDTIRDEGMRLMIVVQQFGWMQDVYGKRTESFLENTCLQLYFGNPGEAASDYLVKALGETEIVKYATTRNTSEANMSGSHQSRGETTSQAYAEGHSTTEQSGTSETTGTSTSHAKGRSRSTQRSRSNSRSNQWNWNNSTNWSDGRNWGEGNGKSMGESYGPHVFWEGFEKSTNYGTTLNKSKGGSHNRGGANARGGGGSSTTQTSHGRTDGVSDTTTQSRSSSRSTSSSHSTGRTYTHTQTTGESHTEGTNESTTHTTGQNVAESFHKKPLIEYHEIRKYLGRVPEDETDHPAYPGLVLAMIGKEEPVLLRRSNYDQDHFFNGLYSKHPKFPIYSEHQRPMLGYEFTPKNILDVKLPQLLVDNGIKLRCLLRPYQAFKKGDPVFALEAPNEYPVNAYASQDGRILNIPKDSNGGAKLRIWDRAGAQQTQNDLNVLFDVHRKQIEDRDRKIREEAERRRRLAEEARKREEARKKEEAEKAWRDYNKRRTTYVAEFYSRGVAGFVLYPLFFFFLGFMGGVIVSAVEGYNWPAWVGGAIGAVIGWGGSRRLMKKRKAKMVKEEKRLREEHGPPTEKLADILNMWSQIPKLSSVRAVFRRFGDM